MSIIRGEYWIDDGGTTTFADGDVGDQNHEMIAFDNAIGLDVEEANSELGEDFGLNGFPRERMADVTLEEEAEIDTEGNDLTDESNVPTLTAFAEKYKLTKKEREDLYGDPVQFLSDVWLKDHGANMDFVEFMEARGDAREWMIEKKNWIRVKGDNFEMWTFDDDALDRIKNCDCWSDVDDPEELESDEFEGEVLIEQVSDRKYWTIPVNALLKATSAAALKSRYRHQINPKKKRKGK